MKRIAISGKRGKGLSALVDDEDYERLARDRWHLTFRGYAARDTYSDGKRVGTQRMHRVILGVKKGQEIDHKNRNPLDNRRENLRVCNRGQNVSNTVKVKGVSQFKGVSKIDGRDWLANVNVDSKCHYVGYFATERHAAMARDMAAKDLYGEFAVLNFPNGMHGPASTQLTQDT